MGKSKSQETTQTQESVDSLLAEAMKLPGVADYLSVYGEYQRLEGNLKSYFASLHPVVSWNTSDTTTFQSS